MLQIKASARTIRRAQISWEQSKADLKLAKASSKSQPDKSCLQSTQAAINAFSSILEAHGYFQLPSFSTIELLDKCIEIDNMFEEIRPLCNVLDSNIERDMFGMTKSPNIGYTHAFAKTCFEACEQIHQVIKTYWKKNKSRFFSP
ncbi:MAG: HEPN domain-containing protein [SAR324 cluster bacterium]|nr:HEPN domain-containing protein [SAR324 cluster bacterium]